MTEPDPTLAQIASQFKRFDIERSRGGYTIIDRRTSDASEYALFLTQIATNFSAGQIQKADGPHLGILVE